MKHAKTPVARHLPKTKVGRIVGPITRFLEIESASGVLLLGCTLVALTLANSRWSESFAAIWEVPVRIGFGSFELNKPFLLWINDGLMTIFFFTVGLEIKRELVAGELRDPKKAFLPLFGAVGGMLAPALIYTSLQFGQPGERGWGIPMATDIAFVVGFLALLGKRVPFGLKIFLLSLAIADDLGAVLVIALFYSSTLAYEALAFAVGGFLLTLFFSRIGVRRVQIYVVLGAVIWFGFLKSGIHPTIAGVLLGMLTPASAWIGDRSLMEVVSEVLDKLRREHHDRAPHLSVLGMAAREAISPLERLETFLHPWVAFFIMPIFALANAGVEIHGEIIGHPISIAVALGLVLGKPIGIVAFSALAVRLKIARLPDGVSWSALLGAGFLGGIGFTMSLFIASLALEGSNLDAAKIGTLAGSLVSTFLGCSLLWWFLPSAKSASLVREESP